MRFCVADCGNLCYDTRHYYISDIKQMFERQFKKHQQLQDSYRTKPNATEWRQCKGIDGIRKELEVLSKLSSDCFML